MGDWKSSAIGGSDAEVMKSGVSKCTCLRSYRGVQKNRSYQSDIYMVCFYVMVLLIVFRNIRLLKYIDVDIHTFSIKEIQISLLLNSVYICSYRDNY